MWPRFLGFLLFVIPPSAWAGDAAPVAGSERFEKKVRPLLAERCWQCHGAEKSKGGLRLDSAEAVAKGGDSGPILVAGKPDESLLIKAVRYHDEIKMPPKGKLPDPEVLELVEWVQSGAAWPSVDLAKSSMDAPSNRRAASFDARDSFWAFQPMRDHAPPSVEAVAWPKSPLDRFILASLERKGLAPAPEAEKRALIRRATFDLTGLPPSPEEVASFLEDRSPEAFAKVVDRLLASPRYGERWGRHWLDLARYADSNGMDENMAYANAYRYRDYVIRAFNADKPYDQFLKEQIAGDLMPSSEDESVNNDHLTATGFLVIGPKMLAEDDPLKMEMDIIDEQVDTVGRVFMGLTIGCARCHDHKFDPIPTADYYAMAGIFKSTKSMQNHKVVAMWNERSLASKADREAIEAHKREIARRKAEIASKAEQAKKAVQDEARSRVGDYLEAARLWERSRQLRHELTEGVISGDDEEIPTGTIAREAESFDRGNVLIDTTNYGQGIGVILNKGELPNHVEYDVTLPLDGIHQLEVRHTAVDPRPTRLKIDGILVASDVGDSVTGSWGPEKQVWSVVALWPLKAGRHIIRLERDGPFPHFDKLALVPRTLPEGFAFSDWKTSAELAAERRLSPKLIEAWAEILDKAQYDTNSIFHKLARTSLTAKPEEVVKPYRESFESAAKADDATLKNNPVLASYRKFLDDPSSPFAVPEKPETLFPPKTVEVLRLAREDLAKFEKAAPPAPSAMGVEEQQKPAHLRVHLRGNFLTLGEEAPRGFPRVVAGPQGKVKDNARSGRLELANWLARGDHPLTARVMVNRIWLGHFGEGILRSPDNFGKLGDRPDHPELLDWLASRFVESGWSIKAMHRLIMLSSTYQMSTKHNDSAALADPDNRLLWHVPRRRLEAEAIRDAILAVSGELDLSMGGTILTTKNHAYVKSMAKGGDLNYEGSRRSVYLPVIRSGLYSVFQAFDFADPSASNGKRIPTTVAPQALFMMNDDLVLRCSEAMGRRLLARTDLDAAGRIRQAYLTAYGRPALDKEVERAEGYLKRFEAELEARGVAPEARPLRIWQAFCQAIFASSEFLYLD